MKKQEQVHGAMPSGIGAVMMAGLAVVAALFLSGCQGLAPSRSQALEQEATALVQRGDLVIAIDATGNIAPRRDAQLGFELSGRIENVGVQEGDQVQAGQLLMALDTTDLTMEAEKARLSLEISQAQLAKLQSGATAEELAAAQANLESARQSLADVMDGPSEAQFAAAEAALRAARDSYQQLLDGPDQDEITVVRADMEKARIALEHAQSEYDKFAWRQGYGASPQAANLQQATVDYQRALASYELKVKDATAAELESALAQVNRAQDELNKLRESPTNAELAAAQTKVAQALVQLNDLVQGASAEDVAVAQAQVEQAGISLHQSQRRLEKAQLLAPYAGTVIAVNTDAGEFAGANVPVVTLADTSAYQIDVLVDEADIARVAPGQKAETTLDSYPELVLTGTVRTVAPEGTMTQGVVSFPVTVELVAEDLPSGLGPNGTGVLLGMTANVRIVQTTLAEVLLLPVGAIRREGLVEYVVVPGSSGPTRRVQVTTGWLEGDQVEITGGDLREGEEVLVSPNSGSNQRESFGPFGR